MAPKNGWLKDERPLGESLFSGAMLVLGREGHLEREQTHGKGTKTITMVIDL